MAFNFQSSRMKPVRLRQHMARFGHLRFTSSTSRGKLRYHGRIDNARKIADVKRTISVRR
jgi:hypothetical protein